MDEYSTAVLKSLRNDKIEGFVLSTFQQWENNMRAEHKCFALNESVCEHNLNSGLPIM